MRTVLAVVFAMTMNSAPGSSAEIIVNQVKGDVEVRSGMEETWNPVAKGDKLKPHDSMKTGKKGSAVLLVTSEKGGKPVKLNLPSDVILDLSDIRKLTRDELILKLTMEKVNASPYDWKEDDLQVPNATVVHGERKNSEAAGEQDEQTALLRMNGTKVLFRNGYFSTCALRGLSLLERFPSLGETFENRYMVAESLERSDLRGEALNEYLALSAMEGLTAEQQRLVRSKIERLRTQG